MKKILIAILALTVACSTNTENKQAEEKWTFFGEEFEANNVIDASEVAVKLDATDSLEITVSGNIDAVCKMKGCWMTIPTEDGKTMRVTFKDYGFFVPKNADGAEVVFTGVAKKKVTDVDTLRHFAEDEGKSEEEIEAITEPKEELVFVATGVKIKDAKADNETTGSNS